MPASCLKLLIDARALIEKGWCQRAFAKNKYGIKVTPHDPSAVCFCMVGAIKRFWSSQEYKACLCLADFTRPHSLLSWQDAPGRTKAEVLEVYDKAIAIAKED